MQQLFTDELVQLGQSVVLSSEQYHHLTEVLHLLDQTPVRLVDASGQTFLALLTGNGRQVIIQSLIEQETMVPIVYGAALIKRDKWELLLQKGTELGATTIVPLITRRTIITVNPKEIEKKVQRWNAITQAACAQSHRNLACTVTAPLTLKEAMAYRQGCNLVPYEKAEGLSLKQALKSGPVTFFIGPEGGWEVEEIDYLKQQGFVCCSLGPRILRAETAGMYTLAVIDSERNG